MIIKKILIIECMFPTFHHYGTRRVLVSNLAVPGEPRPRLVPTPTTTPLSGWVLTCAVWATPSALLAPCLLVACSWVARSVGSTSVRSAPLRMAELRYGGWLRWTSLRSDHRSHAPTLRIRHPPLSFTLSVPPRSLDQKAVFGTTA